MMFKSIQIIVGSSSGFVSHRFKPTHGSCGLSLISVSITRPFLSSSYASFTATTYSVLRLPKSSLSKNSPCCFRAIRMSLTNPESNPDGSSSISSSSAPSSSSVSFHSSGSARKINFCQSCGGPTKHEIPDGEEKLRAVCTLCGKIAYENPKMVVGCLVEHDNKILLCKRNIQPSYGLWTLPAGYMEMGESATEGAIRETLEEANAEVDVLSPFVQLDIPLISQTYIIFLAKLKKPHFSPGPESLECQLFALGDIPFDSLAFSSMLVTLSLYVEDRKVGQPKFHYGVINKRPGTSPSDIRAYTLDHHMQSSYN